MFDPKLYREACRELKAPEDKIEEVIAMTENKKIRRPLRTALICAAAVAMMVVGVSAANPEMIEVVTGRIAEIIQVDQYRREMVTEDGGKVTIFTPLEASVENRNGRAILVIDGEDVADITDPLTKEGRFEYDDVTEKTQIHITVEGSVEDWTVWTSIDVPDGNTPYTITMDSEGNGMAEAPAADVVYEDVVTEEGVNVTIRQYVDEDISITPKEK